MHPPAPLPTSQPLCRKISADPETGIIASRGSAIRRLQFARWRNWASGRKPKAFDVLLNGSGPVFRFSIVVVQTGFIFHVDRKRRIVFGTRLDGFTVHGQGHLGFCPAYIPDPAWRKNNLLTVLLPYATSYWDRLPAVHNCYTPVSEYPY